MSSIDDAVLSMDCMKQLKNWQNFFSATKFHSVWGKSFWGPGVWLTPRMGTNGGIWMTWCCRSLRMHKGHKKDIVWTCACGAWVFLAIGSNVPNHHQLETSSKTWQGASMKGSGQQEKPNRFRSSMTFWSNVEVTFLDSMFLWQLSVNVREHISDWKWDSERKCECF